MITDRFDELLDPGKAKGLRTELSRFPKMTGNGIPQGYIYACAEPERVGRMPIRTDLQVEKADPVTGWTVLNWSDELVRFFGVRRPR